MLYNCTHMTTVGVKGLAWEGGQCYTVDDAKDTAVIYKRRRASLLLPKHTCDKRRLADASKPPPADGGRHISSPLL